MSDRQQELATLIAAEHAGYARLLETLQTEQSYLISGGARPLETLAQEKAAELEELDILAHQRGDHMRVLGLSSIEDWKKWLINTPALLSAWQHVEILAQRASLANDINGQLIVNRLDATNEALEVLFTSDQSTFAYRRDGGARSVVSGGRNLGSA